MIKQQELFDYATKKSDELIDEFAFKSQQLGNRYRLRLLNDVKAAKSTLMKEIGEHLRMVDTFDLKTDVTANLKRVNNQCRALKKSVESRLEVDKLASHLKLKNFLKIYFESNINQNEINELYELIKRLDVKSFFDFESSAQLVEPAAARELAKSFEVKGKETIENIKSSLSKSGTDFQNEVMQLKNDIDKQTPSEKSLRDSANPKNFKETLKAETDRELKRILGDLAKADQSDQIRDYKRQLTTNKKIYMNELAKSDCSLTIQCLEHIKTLKMRLWVKFILTFGEFVQLIGQEGSEASKLFKSDTLLLKSLNECVERSIKNYDVFAKTNDQKLEAAVKKLKELDDQFAEELRTGEKQTNRPV